ncbi:putative colanic acid biosysnthesis UDP-glucose lipid carrier transferase [Soonwooa buanensis]|uniref:Putative colanic acid biosysnthesis UDP-glucose lipid carrier transferase n=1 Tax=Soonwooa buanensis TaxID=619805 RepID=A0A1T5G2H3_9FLAO|nr:exopolysaccharide biosynthesis polyprenyl glycosylphosphotransferase [Soonwooa buanensis]SKC02673.1 putative colanic acid biosysnthesis UDP-glucose lipid carrier transferase [Soonwooa buanensis]
MILLDMILVASVFVIFYYRNFEWKYDSVEIEQNLLSTALLCLFWILLSGRTRLYHVPRSLTFTSYLERIIVHIFIFFLGVILLGKVSNNEFLKTERFYLAGFMLLVMIPFKSLVFSLLKYIRTLGKNHRNVMLIGESTSTEILKEIIETRPDYGYKIYDYPHSKIDINELITFWKKEGIHTVFLPSENCLEADLERKIFLAAESNKVIISLVPNIIQNNFFEYDINYIVTLPVLTPTKYPLDYFTNALLKRCFDIVFSVVVLFGVCSWLFPIIAILIKLDSKGSIFFKQKRYGFHEEIFECWKFRTMVNNADSTTKTTEVGDKRITKLGKFLRKSSIDELPQFINVFKGEMSVIGPRPHMLLVDEFYKPKISRYSIRSLVKPGITGLAQVNGLRGDDGDMNIQMKKRALADAFYVKNWSFSLDFVIILKTIYLVIVGDKNAR